MTSDDFPTLPNETPGPAPTDSGTPAELIPLRQPKRRGPGKAKLSGTKSTAIRHHVDVTLTVASSSPLARRLLVSASGASAEMVDTTSAEDVAITVLEHEPQTIKCLQKVNELAHLDADESACESTVVAMENKSLFKLVWGVIGVLDAELPKSPPAVQARAGLALSRAIRCLDESLLDTVAEVLEVLG